MFVKITKSLQAVYLGLSVNLKHFESVGVLGLSVLSHNMMAYISHPTRFPPSSSAEKGDFLLDGQEAVKFGLLLLLWP